jgi:hypothetical protein
MPPEQGRPTVHLPGEGRAIDMGSFGMTVKADAATTGGSFTILEASRAARLRTSHAHP